MKPRTVRELPLKVDAVPGAHQAGLGIPDREALILSGQETMDSGLILEQDRT